MNTIKFGAAVTVNKGKIRKNNEDNLYLNGLYLDKSNRDVDDTYTTSNETEVLMYGVFDGMGGEALGEEASYFAAQTLYEANKKKTIERAKNIDAAVNGIIQTANEKICKKILESGERRIGTTFALLCVQDDLAKIYNIGDSRVYLLRNNELRQISVDDTTGQRLVNMGVITKEQLSTHEDRHKLTQHLGIFKDEMEIEPHIATEITIKKGDKFLLCSDGLTDMVDDEEIKEILKKNKSEKEISEALVEEALSNGGHDNITAMIIIAKTSSKQKPAYSKNKRKTIACVATIAFLILAAILAFAIPKHLGKEEVKESNYIKATALNWTTSTLRIQEMTIGDVGRLGVLYEPSNITGEAVYTSSNSNVLSVNEKTGEYVAQDTGKTTITATLDDLKINLEVMVYAKVEKIYDITDRLNLRIGEIKVLEPKVSPESAKQRVTYICEDENVAKVDENGIVSAVAAGKTNIVIVADDLKHIVNVNVLGNSSSKNQNVSESNIKEAGEKTENSTSTETKDTSSNEDAFEEEASSKGKKTCQNTILNLSKTTVIQKRIDSL